MAVAQTQAALVMQEQAEQLTSHQVISLLMDGAIERASSAIMAIHSGNDENKEILVRKLSAIINGLRESLDFKQGGEIAENLGALYEYMMDRLASSRDDSQEHLAAITEVRRLIAEIKSGWDNMDIKVPQLAEGA